MPLSDPGELERLRGAAALKSIGSSPNASRLLAGKGRSQRSNEIASKSIERSGLNRDQVVSAARNDRPRYDRMVSNASQTNAEKSEIAQRAGTALGQGLASRVKTVTQAQTKPTAQTAQAPTAQAPVKRTPQQSQAQTQQVRRTQAQQTTAANKTSGLTPEQIKQYNRAWSNKGNFLARGTIRSHYNKLTPEQQKAFRAHAQSQGHDWGNYFECYFDAVDSGKIIITEAILGSIIKAAARQSLKTKALQKTVAKSFDKGAKMAVGKAAPKTVKLPRTTTGFQTARGSKYSYTPRKGTFPSTQRTAVKDPYHPTPAGTKQKSDFSLFTTPEAGFEMKDRFVGGASRKDFFKGLPVGTQPKIGRSPVEVWGNYQGSNKRAIHLGNKITDLQTQGSKNTLPLYGQQRREIQQRVKAALRKKQNVDVLKKELKQGNESSINDLYRRRNNPSNPNTLENELRGRYRGKGVGRKETTTEQLAPIEKENQLPGKFSKIVVTTDTPADRMKSLKKRVGRYGKGLQRMSDIYPNYP